MHAACHVLGTLPHVEESQFLLREPGALALPGQASEVLSGDLAEVGEMLRLKTTSSSVYYYA